MGFFRQVYWGELPCPPPGDLSDPGIEQAALTSPELVCSFFTCTIWKASNGRQYQTFQHVGNLREEK